MPLRLILLATLLLGATVSRAEQPSIPAPAGRAETELPVPEPPQLEPRRLGEPAPEPSASNPQWSVDQVGLWAAAQSPVANLLETERAAVAAEVDRDDREACRRVRQIQAVLAELAQHERNRAAADAMAAHYEIVGVERQQERLAEAEEILQQLIELAERAAELELAGGEANPLRRRRLEIQDAAIEADFGARKLRRRLAHLTGRQPRQAAAAVLADPLDIEPSVPETDAAVATATAQRHDLAAIRALCQRTCAETVPVSRQLLSSLQPGLGLTSGAVPKTGLLLHHLGRPGGESSAWRRRQCQQLLQTRTEQVRSEVVVALWDLQEASQRAALAEQKRDLAREAAAEQAQAVQLDEAPAGSDLRAQLETTEAESAWIDRLVDRAVAEVRLREAQGELAD